jgi:hypothetical protein
MFPRSKSPDRDPLTLAARLGLGVAALVVLAAAGLWGRPGVLAAAVGSLVSIVNLAALAWLSARAARRAAAQADGESGGAAAASGLQAALSAKTALLLVVVGLLVGGAGGGLHPAALAMGLLVSVFALLLASGLSAAATG